MYKAFSTSIKVFTTLTLTLIDLFHKSKNDLSFADYLYQRILNIHA